MKNYSTLLSALALVLVIVLYIIQFAGTKQNDSDDVAEEQLIDTSGVEVLNTPKANNSAKIAYFNSMDYTEQYELAKKLGEKLQNDKIFYESEFEKQTQEFYKSYEELQKFSQMGGVTEQQQLELMNKEQDLQRKQVELQNKLGDSQMAVSSQLNDSLINFLKEFNADGRYQHVVDGAVMLNADESLDITDSVITILNERYNKSQVK